MRAGDERIKIAAVGGIEHFGEAGVAGRHVRCDRGPCRTVLLAVANDKIAFVGNERSQFRLDVVNARKRWCLRNEVVDEGLNVALHLHEHAILVIAHAAAAEVAIDLLVLDQLLWWLDRTE